MGDDTTTAAPANRAALHADDDLRGTPFADCSAEVLRLAEAVERLEQHTGVLQMPALSGREWYELLIRKLVPQLGDSPFLVAAVVGGTNIGKSVIFNHLAGCKVSATSPLASGTRHPVCLIPPGFADRHSLADIFQGFELHPWEAADAALEDHRENRLYWQENEHLPSNLLVLDTPDIDSDAPVNWLRADYIRHCADVLIAVLTQQKYNDAAVKQFFRKAAAEDKAVIVVFNQCLLPEDEEYWPLWLGTFTRETGVAPVELYIAPNDRRSAESNRLPFYERSPEGTTGPRDETPHDLRKELTQLHFADIKVRALRGSLRQILDHQQGAPAYLDELRARSRDFEGAAELMTSQQLARIQNWPGLPNRILVGEIRHWWRMQRQGWTRTIHETYNVLGDGVAWGFRWAKEKLSGPDPDPLENYRRQERDVMLAAIGDLYDGLTNLSRLGNELLRPRLANLLGGEQRSQLINEVSRSLDQVRLEEEIRDVVCTQMQQFRTESPQLHAFLSKLDSAAAAARPMTSVVLFFAGGGALGDAMLPMVHDAAANVVLHIAAGTGTMIAGETALSGTSAGLRAVEAHFRKLQTSFTERRVTWFAELLKANLLGSLQDELHTAATLPRSADFRQVEACLQSLANRMAAEQRDKSA